MRCCCNELSPDEQLAKSNSDEAVRILTHFIKDSIKSGNDISSDMLGWYHNDRKLALSNLYGISNDKTKKLEEEIRNIESLMNDKWDAEFLAAQKLIGVLPYGDKVK